MDEKPWFEKGLAIRVHAVRRLLHRGAGLCVGQSRGDRSLGPRGRHGRAGVRGQVRSQGGDPQKPDRIRQRRLRLFRSPRFASAPSTTAARDSAEPGPSGNRTWSRKRPGRRLAKFVLAAAKESCIRWSKSCTRSRSSSSSQTACARPFELLTVAGLLALCIGIARATPTKFGDWLNFAGYMADQ